MFDNRRHFGELLVSEERIASNVLADRLKMLLAEGLVTRRDHPTHKQKAIYSLTEKGISLFPVLAEISRWGHSNIPRSVLNKQGQAILKGGRRAWERFMADLRKIHLDERPQARRRRAKGVVGNRAPGS